MWEKCARLIMGAGGCSYEMSWRPGLGGLGVDVLKNAFLGPLQSVCLLGR